MLFQSKLITRRFKYVFWRSMLTFVWYSELPVDFKWKISCAFWHSYFSKGNWSSLMTKTWWYMETRDGNNNIEQYIFCNKWTAQGIFENCSFIMWWLLKWSQLQKILMYSALCLDVSSDQLGLLPLFFQVEPTVNLWCKLDQGSDLQKCKRTGKLDSMFFS